MILKGLVDRLDVGRLGRCGREPSDRRQYEGRDKSGLAARFRYNDFAPRHLSNGGGTIHVRKYGEKFPRRHGLKKRFNFYGDQIDVKFESWVCDPWNSWLRLRYSTTEYWTGEEIEIDDQIYLAATRPHFGGLRWWFVCPHLNRRVRKLYLPCSGR